MKLKIYALLLAFAVIIVGCGEVETPDPCETDNTGFLTVTNGTSGIDGIGMDIAINGDYIQTISSEGSSDLIELDLGDYTITGEATDKTRLWTEDVTITQCNETRITLGN